MRSSISSYLVCESIGCSFEVKSKLVKCSRLNHCQQLSYTYGVMNETTLLLSVIVDIDRDFTLTRRQ